MQGGKGSLWGKKVAFYGIYGIYGIYGKKLLFMVFPPPAPLLLELLSHFFESSLTKNFKNNFFTVFSLLAHWHLFAFNCFKAKKKVPQNFWFGQDPLPHPWKKTTTHI